MAVTTMVQVRGPQAWTGPEMAGRDEWIHQLDDAEIAEVEAAVDATAGKPLLEVDADAFPLPTLSRRLARMKREILFGRGFHLLRGLPVDKWDIESSALAFWGIGRHLGAPCSQNGKGHVLGHVKNLGLDYADPMTRGYQTSARLPYHTDSSDIVGLLCLKAGRAGGLSSIVSSTTLYNEMARRHPDLLPELTRPFHRTRWGEIPEGRDPWAEVPVFMPCGGRIVAHYVRSAIRKAQGMDGVPELTDRQVAALDALDALAEDPDLHLDMEFRPGDVQLLCNHWIMHSRTSYEDWPETERRRHLLRLWLACADGPALPAAYLSQYEGPTATGRPNGIQVPGVPFQAPLEAA